MARHIILFILTIHLQNLKSLKDYFLRGGLSDEMLNTHNYTALVTRLDMNTIQTKDLILNYYENFEHHSVSGKHRHYITHPCRSTVKSYQI